MINVFGAGGAGQSAKRAMCAWWCPYWTMVTQSAMAHAPTAVDQ